MSDAATSRNESYAEVDETEVKDLLVLNSKVPNFSEINDKEIPDINNDEIPDINNDEIPDINNDGIPEINNDEISKINNDEISKINNDEISKINNDGIKDINNDGISVFRGSLDSNTSCGDPPEIPDYENLLTELTKTRKKFFPSREFEMVHQNQYRRVNGYLRMSGVDRQPANPETENERQRLCEASSEALPEPSISEEVEPSCDLDDDETISESTVPYPFYEKAITTLDVIDQILIKPKNGLPSNSEGRPQFTFTKSSNASSSSETLVSPGGEGGCGAMTAEEAMKICNTSLEYLLKSGFWPKKRGWITNERVVRSGILSEMSSNKRCQQESLFEILTSEKSYLVGMQLLVEHFMNNEDLKNAINLVDPVAHNHLFSNANLIAEASDRMYTELNRLWRKDFVFDVKKVCEVMMSTCHENSEKYVNFCLNRVYQQQMLDQLRKKPQIVHIIKALESDKRVKGLNIDAYLILPFQRVTRMPLLIRTVQSFFSDNDDAAVEIQKCLEAFEEVATKCDEGVWKMTCYEKMVNVNAQLNFGKDLEISVFYTFPIVTPTRILMKEGDFKSENIHIFVFNDLVLITKMKKGNMYSVISYSPKSKIKVETNGENVPKKQGLKLVMKRMKRLSGIESDEREKRRFVLEFLEKDTKYKLLCDSEIEKLRWIDALTTTSEATSEEPNAEELTPEKDADNEQVKTVTKFEATEPDEIDLQESDVIMILQKTSTGWYKGLRMRDGRSGWFQAKNTLKIPDRDVRLANCSIYQRPKALNSVKEFSFLHALPMNL